MKFGKKNWWKWALGGAGAFYLYRRYTSSALKAAATFEQQAKAARAAGDPSAVAFEANALTIRQNVGLVEILKGH